jgi:hypothetical protein
MLLDAFIAKYKKDVPQEEPELKVVLCAGQVQILAQRNVEKPIEERKQVTAKELTVRATKSQVKTGTPQRLSDAGITAKEKELMANMAENFFNSMMEAWDKEGLLDKEDNSELWNPITDMLKARRARTTAEKAQSQNVGATAAGAAHSAEES